ncbi:MAG TPA: hypothetical protein PK657_01580 [Legionella sp.]|nr:hypothetical protein [Legionella sp.]
MPLPYQLFKNQPILDLSPYLLNKFSDAEFEEMIGLIKKMPNLKHLRLTNCGLDKLAGDKIYALLFDLKQLTSIDMRDNNLSTDKPKLQIISKALYSLPNLMFFLLYDKEQNIDPDFLSDISYLPTFRAFKEQNSSSFSFLNRHEINLFMQLVINEPVIHLHYFINPYSLQTIKRSDFLINYKTLLENTPNLEKAHIYRSNLYRSPDTYPKDAAEVLRLFDKINESELTISYNTEHKIFILNLGQVNTAACERILRLVDTELPPYINWEMILPNTFLNHFTQNILDGFLKRNSHHKIKNPYPKTNAYAFFNSNDEDYRALKSFNELLVLGDLSLYKLLNDKHSLFQLVHQLTVQLDSKREDIHYLIYDLFISHKLCQTTEINTLEHLRQAIKNHDARKLNHLKQEILDLLHGNPDALSRQLNNTMNLNNMNEPVEPGCIKSAKRTMLQANAFWGILAFYRTYSNHDEGIFWYGRFLHEMPCSKINADFKLPYAKTLGIYWLRYAATHFHNKQAINYLIKLHQTQEHLKPAVRYHLIMACEALEIPNVAGEKFSPYSQLYNLFPNRNFFKSLFLPQLKARNISLKNINENFNSFITTEKQDELSELFAHYELYLWSLLQDDLLTEHGKAEVIKKLFKDRGRMISNAAYCSDSPIKKYCNEIIQHHSAPLGFQIKVRLLPVLKRFELLMKNCLNNQHGLFAVAKSIMVLNNYHLDKEKPMGQNSEELRVLVFCQFFTRNLKDYLKTSTIFNSKLESNESPSYAATLIHSLITHALDYFVLAESDLGKILHQIMLEIKQDLHDLFFQYQLAHQPSSLGFQKAIITRLQSYSLTGFLSKTTKLTLLKKFGENPHKKENKDIIKQGVHAAALVIEVLHIALPVVLGITGIGIPAALGSSIALKGLHQGLEKIHNFTKTAENVLEHHADKVNAIRALSETYHLPKEAGLGTRLKAASQLIELETLNHFNELLAHAAVTDNDNIFILLHHWTEIYKPITDKLTQTSNTVLGILLVELLMRGLTVRLAAEKQNPVAIKNVLPTTIAGLLDYFNETMWRYSLPNASDDALLLTQDLKTVSALRIIFPESLLVKNNSNFIEVDIQPQNLPRKLHIIGNGKARRYASSFELNQLLLIKEGNGNTVFYLSEITQQPIDWSNLQIAYFEKQLLAGNLAALITETDWQHVQFKIQNCVNLNRLLFDRVIKFPVINKKEIIRVFDHLEDQLLAIAILLEKYQDQLKNPEHNCKIPEFLTKKSGLSLKEAILVYIDRAHKVFIYVDRQNQLNTDAVKALTQFDLDEKQLIEAINSIYNEIAEDKVRNTQRLGYESKGFFRSNNSQPKEDSDTYSKFYGK